MSTRQQKWSMDAHGHVTEFKNQKGDTAAKLKTFCYKFPSLVQQAGLIQALVFVDARGSDGGRRFLDAVALTLGEKNRTSLRARAQRASVPEYLALTQDVSDVAIWFRRFAQIELGDEEA